MGRAAGQSPTLETRFWAKVERWDPDECWLWTASTTAGRWGGYGQVCTRHGQRPALAHRLAHELLVGPIPVGMEVNHLCEVKRCVNPKHLELLTPSEHARKTHLGRRKPVCKYGHPLTPENRLATRGGCRICKRARWHEFEKHLPQNVGRRR